MQVSLRERTRGPAHPNAELLADRRDLFQETQHLVGLFVEVVKEAYKFVFSKLGDHEWSKFEDCGTGLAEVQQDEREALADNN